MVNGNSQKTKNLWLREFVQSNGSVVIFLVIWILAAIFVPNFATFKNSLSIIKQAAIPMITAIAMTFVLILGGIDLSTGYIVGLASTFIGIFMINNGWSLVISLIAVLAIGLLCGIINGILVQVVKVPPFITTLGTGYVIRGIANIACNGATQSGLPKELMALGRTKIFDFTSTVYIAIVISIILFVLLHKTVFGRSLCSIGLNPKAAYMSGIKSTKLVVITYALSGMLAAVAGILLTIRVNCAQPDQGGANYTFNAIVASVLGGASMFGGKGTVYGALLGVFSMSIIENCLTLLNADAYLLQAILGIVIMLAIIFENVKQRIMR